VSETAGGSTTCNRILTIVVALASVAVAVIGFFEARNTDLSFDGGMNSQVAISLVEDGRYATRYRGLQDFNHVVQSGPPLMLPVAAVYWALGAGNTVFQLPNLVYLILACMLGVLFAGRRAGPAGALLAALLIVQTPRLFDLGLRLYGEVPAVAFFLCGAFLLDRCAGAPGARIAAATGVLFGLAVQTKIMMVIPAAGLAVAFLVDRRLGKRVPLRSWCAMLVGAVASFLPFETYKLLVLGPALYREWWATMIRRSLAEGTSIGMSRTLHGVQKVSGHLGILAQKTHYPAWLLLLFLATTTVLLVVMLARRWITTRDPRAIPPSLVVLGAGAALNFSWWIVLSPTSRTWLRRVLPGLIFQEIVASVVVVWAGKSLYKTWRELGRRHALRSGFAWAIGILGILLATGSGTLLWSGLPRIKIRRRPTPRRVAEESMADTIRHLSSNAVLYARGWYQAPVLAALTGRVLRDFNEFPLTLYDQPLRNTYFVVDAAFFSNEPGQVQEVLERTDHQLIRRKDKFSLYRLNKVFPYPPIPEPGAHDEVATVYRPEDGPYRFAKGVGWDPAMPRLSRAACGVLLAPGNRRCLHVKLWIPLDMGPHPVLEIRLGGVVVSSTRPSGGGQWDRTLELPAQVPLEAGPVLVDLRMLRDGDQPPFILLPSTGFFTLSELGFVDCAAAGAPTGRTSDGAKTGAPSGA